MGLAENAAAVRLDGVSKVYGGFAALRHVSCELPAGCATLVLGGNGAGKSTLLRLLAGLTVPSFGTVEVLGGAAQAQRGRVGYMAHAAMLYEEMTALENLRYFAALGGEEGCRVCTGSSEMALTSVGLDPGLKRPVAQYSQGMRQRASLARVLQGDPALLLLDEPFSNLDVASAEAMVRLLGEYLKWPAVDGMARTVVLTTHQAHLAEGLAAVTLRVEGGALVSFTRREAVA